MKLSTKGRYAVTAMVCLAQHAKEGPVPLRAMADTCIPPDYLEQILGTLRKAGLVATSRGAQGGYSLARSPEEITVGEIICATEGPVRFCECDTADAVCTYNRDCDTRPVWMYLAREINGLLDGITLESVMADFGGEGEGR